MFAVLYMLFMIADMMPIEFGFSSSSFASFLSSFDYLLMF